MWGFNALPKIVVVISASTIWKSLTIEMGKDFCYIWPKSDWLRGSNEIAEKLAEKKEGKAVLL